MLYLFGQMINGLLNLGWVKVCEVEATKAEFHSFAHEHYQTEQNGNLRNPITDVFSFCCGQPGFCSRRHLYQVSTKPENFQFPVPVILMFCTFHILSFQGEHTPALVHLMFVFADLPANSARGLRVLWIHLRTFSLSQWAKNCPS